MKVVIRAMRAEIEPAKGMLTGFLLAKIWPQSLPSQRAPANAGKSISQLHTETPRW